MSEWEGVKKKRIHSDIFCFLYIVDHGNDFLHFGLEQRPSNLKHKEMLLMRYGVYTFANFTGFKVDIYIYNKTTFN